ncbi:MAG TPA: efflux RND transporter permease subunit, partial [Firmicutes bacterium]|nr:efflux RND transporter permease subunit [Bacillota bacterium]
MNLAGFSIRRPVAISMVVLVLLVLGGVSLSRIPIDLLPEMNVPVAVVMANYPGAGSEEVENLVTRPLEAVLATVGNVKQVQSESAVGSSMVMVEFNWGTDMNTATLEMREKIDLVAPMLPEGVKRPTVYKFDPSMMPVMMIGVSGEGRDLASLKRLLEDKVVGRLERLDGVAYAALQGGPTQKVEIRVDQERLAGYGLSLAQLTQALAAENMNLPGGTVEDGQRVYVVRTTGEFKCVEEIRDLTVLTLQGVPLRLGDVADVVEVEDAGDQYTLLNDHPGMSIMIQKETGANTVQVAKRIHQEMAKIGQEMPDVQYSYVFDQSEFIQRAIGNLAGSAVQGGLLAVLILFLFLRNFRSTLIIGLAIPISIIATFTLVYFNGLTLNMMSLGGLALGVGMLVDNSIVVLENIYRHREEGEGRLVAAENGTNEVALAISASTLTTVAVFVPIVFVQGLIAEIFRQLALTVTFSLLASLAVAVTLVPMLAGKLLKVNGPAADPGAAPGRLGFLARLGEAVDGLNTRYRRALAWSLDHRRLVLAAAAGAFVVSLVLVPLIGTEFFPPTDAGRLTITINLPEGSPLAATGQVAERVEKAALAQPEVKTVFMSVGSAEAFGPPGMPTSTERATLDIALKPRSERSHSDRQVADAIRQEVSRIAGARIQVSAMDMMSMQGGGVAKPLSIQLRGDDLDVLRSLADKVAEVVKSVPGTREVETSFKEGRPEIQVRLNRAKAAGYGFTAAQVAQTVDTAVNGKAATRYRAGGDEIDIVVQLAEGQRQNLSDLKGLILTSPLGVQVPLAEVADLTTTIGPRSISRDNQVRVVSVSGDVLGRPLGTVSAEVAQKLKALRLPDGYSYEFGGQNKEMQDAFSGLGLAFV